MYTRRGAFAVLLGLALSIVLLAPVVAADQRPMSGQFTAQAHPQRRGVDQTP